MIYFELCWLNKVSCVLCRSIALVVSLNKVSYVKCRSMALVVKAEQGELCSMTKSPVQVIAVVFYDIIISVGNWL